jgi:hypothetical protein
MSQLAGGAHLIDQNNSHHHQTTPFNTPSSITITNNTLARIFSILIKLIHELLAETIVSHSKNNTTTTSSSLHIVHRRLIKRLHQKLDMPWKWLVTIMDSTESQLRFGASLSASQANDLSMSATKYLRHLEERALLTNYFNNSQTGVGAGGGGGSSSSSGSAYYSGVSGGSGGGGGPFISSRFGSGIDARRKLTIMQHQHQQFSNMSGGLGGGSGGLLPVPYNHHHNNNNNNNNQPVIISSNTTSAAASAAASLASQFASSQIIASRRDFMSYTLSLMRTYTNEHRDFLPSVDISLLKHVAYAFDGFMFYLRMTKWSLLLNQDKLW